MLLISLCQALWSVECSLQVVEYPSPSLRLVSLVHTPHGFIHKAAGEELRMSRTFYTIRM